MSDARYLVAIGGWLVALPMLAGVLNYLAKYYREPGNAYRFEYLEGAILFLLPSVIACLVTLLAIWGYRRALPHWQFGMLLGPTLILTLSVLALVYTSIPQS